MSNQGFIPVTIDLDTLQNTPEMIQVRNAGNFTAQESARWNGMARLTNLNTFLTTDPDLDSARDSFLRLDPEIQKALLALNPEAPYAKANENFFLRKLKTAYPVRLFREPLRTLGDTAEYYVSAIQNTVLNIQKGLNQLGDTVAAPFQGAAAIDKVTNPDYWTQGWNGYGKWNQEAVSELDDYYNKATGVFVKGILDQKTPLDIFREYGAIDPDMVNIYSKFGTPEFDEIADRYSRHKINLGSKIVDWAGRFAPLKEKPTAPDIMRESIAAAVLSIGGMRNVSRNQYGEFVTERLFSKGEYKDPGPGLDVAALFFVDPLTYVTFGGSRGLGTFASARNAAQLQSAVDGTALLKNVEDLFNNPSWYAKNNSFVNDMNVYRDALKNKDIPAAGAARLKISMDHPEYDDDNLIGLLEKSTILKEGKEVPITDMDSFYDWFKTGENIKSITDGTVNNIITAREGTVALQTRTRRMVNGLRSYGAKIFQGLDRDAVIGAKPLPGEIVDNWVDLEKTILSRPALNGIDTSEEMLSEIAKNDSLLESLVKPRNYSIKNINRLFGETFARMPASRSQIFWTDALVDKGIDNLRNYIRLITGDRFRTEFLVQLYKTSSKNDRINMLFNLDKLYLDSIGASVTPMGVAYRDALLNSRYINTELASISDYVSDVPEIFKGLDNVQQLPPGPSAFMHNTDGITLFDFDNVIREIYQSLGDYGQRSVRAAKFKYPGSKNIVKKLGYMYYSGSTNGAVSRAINRGLVFLLLVPKLGVKNAVDEATVLANVTTPSFLGDLLYGKGRQLSNINIAIKGDTSFQGPVKTLLLNSIGRNPAKFADAAYRKELSSMKMLEVPVRDPDTGIEVIQKELISAEEFFGMPPEEILVLSAIEKYGNKFTPQEKALIADYYIYNSDTASDAMIGSIVGATYGDSMALGTKLAKEIYGKSPLTQALDNIGLKVLSKPYVDTLNRLNKSERTLAHYSYFWRLFSKNEKYGVNAPETFLRRNALKTEQDLQSFMDDTMVEFGWKTSVKPDVERAIMLNDEFGQVGRLRELGIPEKEISQMIIKNMALEMRYVFHGGTGYNQALYDLLRKKLYAAYDEVDITKSYADKRMLERERAGAPEPLSFAEEQRRYEYYRKKQKWTTQVGKLNFEEFEKATDGFTVQGPIKTDIAFPEIEYYDLNAPDGLTKLMQKGYEFMDRQVNDLTRSDVFLLKVLEERKKLLPNQQLYVKALVENGSDYDTALIQASAIFANQAKHNASDTILKYVDNPVIRTQLAFNMRVVGRFIRAAEDFSKRTLRWILRHPESIPYRIGHVGHAADGSGITHEDDDGNIYVVIPNDGVFWQDIAPAIVMLANPLYSIPTLAKIGADAVLTGQSIKDSPYWGFFKQAEWNQYTMKVSLLNPSYAEGAGAYTLIGPNIALPVVAIREFLVGAGTRLQSPEIYNFGLSIDNILLGEVADDTDLLRATIPPALSNYIKSLSGEYKDNTGIVAAYQAISYMQYTNPKKPEDFLNAEGVYDPSKAQKFLDEWRIQTANVLAQKAAFNTIFGAPLQLGSPDISKYLRDMGTISLTKEYGDILRGVLQFNQENGFPIPDPYTTAVSLHALERPGKLIFQVPKGLKETKTAINYTQETLSWSIKNKKYIESFPTAAWIFAPNIGEYNPKVITYMEAADLIPPSKNAFDNNNAALRSYIERTTVAKQLYQYYQYDREVEKLLSDPNNPRRNFVDYRTELKATAAARKEALLNNNPLLKNVFGTRQFQSTEDLRSNFSELRTIVSEDLFPKGVSLETKDLLTMMVRSSSELLLATEGKTVGSQYLGDTELQTQVTDLYSKYEQIARQNSILGEAWSAIIRPLLDKTYDIPFRVVRKPGD